MSTIEIYAEKMNNTSIEELYTDSYEHIYTDVFLEPLVIEASRKKLFV